MKTFKDLLKSHYGDVSVDELKLKRMHSQILARIDKVDERKQELRWFRMARVAAVFAIIIASYYFFQETALYMNKSQVLAKIDVLVDEALDKKEDFSTTIVSYQTPEDVYLAMINKRLAKLEDNEKEDFLQEIF